MSKEIALHESSQLAEWRTASDVVQQVEHVQEIMRSVMREGEHYGVIPGTKKNALLKPGAEKICFTFRLASEFEITEKPLAGDHREIIVKCILRDQSGRVLGEGVGSCSTMESKYRWREAQRTCPVCDKPAIIKGKAEFGGGWLCFAKKGGCGAKFPEGSNEIEGQKIGRIENQDIPDAWNTVLKMAKKRAHVDATITTTATSDIFAQDVEEEGVPGYQAPSARPAPASVEPTDPALETEYLAALADLKNVDRPQAVEAHSAWKRATTTQERKLIISQVQDTVCAYQDLKHDRESEARSDSK